MPKKKTMGYLVIVGGAEDREDAKLVLSRVTDLAGGERARIVVLTTASKLAGTDESVAQEFQDLYEGAFRDTGAAEVTTLHIHDRAGADDAEHAAAVDQASCIFMTGGDQARLVNILGGTAVGEAMHRAFQERGAVISGTSAGASAFSRHMIAGGPSEYHPIKGGLGLAPGLGFLNNIIVDQHFSQRGRISRLLSLVAQFPFLVGVGIDEDTALVLGPDDMLEVVGSGTVTVLDGRQMTYSNVNEIAKGEVLAVNDVKLHLLPTGFRFCIDPESKHGVTGTPGFRGLAEAMTATW